MLKEILAAAGIENFGVADYGDTLPGTGYRKRDMFDGISSVIVCLVPWDTGMNEGRNMARYAVGKDYHLVAGEHLAKAAKLLESAFPGETFRPFVDTSPVAEVRAAVLAGLGVRGRNNLFISKAYGTRCAICEILSTKHFEKSEKSAGTCLNCMRCVESCPSGALTKDGYEREKCVSFINQKKKELTPKDRELIKEVGFICGCDRCADVCPMNSGTEGSGWNEFKESAKPVYFPGMDISDRAYSWKPESAERNYKIITED